MDSFQKAVLFSFLLLFIGAFLVAFGMSKLSNTANVNIFTSVFGAFTFVIGLASLATTKQYKKSA